MLALGGGEAELGAARAAYAAGDLAACRRALARGIALEEGTGSATEASLRVLEARALQWEAADVGAARRAWKLAHAAGADVAMAEIALGTALYLVADRSAVPHLRRARELAARERDAATAAEASILLAVALLSFGRSKESLAVVEALLPEAEAAGLDAVAASARFLAARTRMHALGEVEQAVPVLESLLDATIGPASDEVLTDLAVALADLGRDAEATALLDSAPAPRTTWGRASLLVVRADVELDAARHARARAVADEALDISPPQLALFAEATRAWSLLELGRIPPEPSPAEPVPYREHLTAEIAGVSALAAGKNDEAAECFAAAANGWRSNVIRSEIRCCWGLGVSRLRGGHEADGTRILRQAGARAARSRLLPLVRRIDASLKRREPPAPTVPLTRRESDVLRLVRAGHTTGAIAERLGIAPTTVETHVRNAIAKLGAHTRFEAAARSAQRVGISTTELDAAERRIVDLLAAGASITEAARLLHLSRRTMTRRVAEIRRKLGAGTTAEMVAAVDV